MKPLAVTVLIVAGLAILIAAASRGTAGRRHVEALHRWLTDPRTGMTVAASLMAAAVIAFVIMSGLTTRDALRTRDRTEAAASRRIDRLQDEIEDLRRQLVDEVRSGSTHIGELIHQIAVLREQVRQLGGRPVVVQVPADSDRRTTSTTAPRRRPQRPPSTTTTTTTTPPPDRGICVADIVCIGGTP